LFFTIFRLFLAYVPYCYNFVVIWITKKLQGNWLNQKVSYGLAGTHDWTRLHVVVDNAPAGTNSIRVSVGLNAGSGTAYFDGVQLEKGTVVSAYNLVDNSSFEQDSNGDGIPDNWTTSGNFSASNRMDATAANVYVGDNSFKITGESGKNKYIKQRIHISGDSNTKLTLSGWSKQEDANPNGGYTRRCEKTGVSPPFLPDATIPAAKEEKTGLSCMY
jgi:hypothetical protein